MSEGASEVDRLTERLEALTRRLDAGKRARLAGTIAGDVRTANVKRMRANVSSDGEPFLPRRPQASRKPGKLRDLMAKPRPAAKAGRMFKKAPRSLIKRATPDGAEIGFTGAAARIMRVHQEGLLDRVSRQPDAPEVVYAKREVLGLSPDDRRRILELATAHLR